MRNRAEERRWAENAGRGSSTNDEDHDDETVIVALGEPPTGISFLVVDRTHTTTRTQFTITDSGARSEEVPTVTVTAASATITEGGSAGFTIRLDKAPRWRDVTVTYYLVASPNAITDYGATGFSGERRTPSGGLLVEGVKSGSVTFTPDGSLLSPVITEPTTNNPVWKPDGNIMLVVTDDGKHDGVYLGTPHTAIVTIQSDNIPPIRTSDDADPHPYADLIADVRGYVAETHHGPEHVKRWKRVLIALGAETYPGLTPMTLTEAQQHAATYTADRWNPIITALTQIENNNPP